MSLQKGLVGHWTMDDSDTSGGTLYDSSAYDNHGTLVNSPTTGVSGKVGEAYTFDGSSNYIQTPLTGDTAKSAYSISAWFNVNSISGSEMIVGNYDGSNGMLARLEGNDVFDLWHDSGSIEGGDVTLGEWTHAVYTYDGSNAAIYKNTTEVASGTIPDSTISNDLRIAETYDNRYFDGELDDVRIYDRVLSESEISALYNMRSQRQQNVIYPTVENIRKGCESMTFSFVANQWNGSSNAGEIDIVNGTTFERVNGGTKDISPINNGVALDDGGSGSGYLMYSRENVHNRFTNPSPHPDNCDHIIGVVYDNGWKYDDNSGADNPFEPKNSDVLVAEFTYAIDSVNGLTGFTR